MVCYIAAIKLQALEDQMMTKKTELLVAPIDITEMKLLAAAGADAFVIGSEKFMLCGRGYFEINTLAEAVEIAHQLGKKIYLAVDAVFPNDLLKELETYLTTIKTIPFDGIRYADLGAYMLIKDMLTDIPLHFVDGMMLTNYETVNYWFERHISRVRLASELTLAEVLEIKSNATNEVEILIHGPSLMFTSRRKLVENYLDFQESIGRKVEMTKEHHFLHDPERELYYPIIENVHGTHIFSGTDVCMIDDLGKLLQVGVDVLYVERFNDETERLIKIIHLYKMAIELAVVDKEKYAKVGRALYVEVEKLQGEFRQLDRGFYYKPTIYKNQNK